MLPNGKSGVSLKERNRKQPPGWFAIRERVKRCGKSAPVSGVTRGAVRLMGCKAKYIPVARQDDPFCFPTLRRKGCREG